VIHTGLFTFTVTALHSPKTLYVQRSPLQNTLAHAMEMAAMEKATLVSRILLMNFAGTPNVMQHNMLRTFVNYWNY
jgi:hypothetical protein